MKTLATPLPLDPFLAQHAWFQSVQSKKHYLFWWCPANECWSSGPDLPAASEIGDFSFFSCCPNPGYLPAKDTLVIEYLQSIRSIVPPTELRYAHRAELIKLFRSKLGFSLRQAKDESEAILDRLWMSDSDTYAGALLNAVG